MSLDHKLIDEDGRLAALRRYDVLDTAREEPFYKLTELVCNVLNVPIAAVSLVDAERQWFKSFAGLNTCETSRDVSFCSSVFEPAEVPPPWQAAGEVGDLTPRVYHCCRFSTEIVTRSAKTRQKCGILG